MKLKELQNKKVLILGLGREGESTFNFLRKIFPEKVFGLADILGFENLSPNFQKKILTEKKVNLHLGKDYLQKIKDYEVIIKSPGIPLRKIKPYLEKKQKITSQTEIFLEECPGEIIGVTGTKGKSTTATLIYKVLKEGKLKAHLMGNIGKPALSYLAKAKKGEIFVYELSSHQLFNLKKSPQIAVFLNIYFEHLDYYKDFKEYFRAKQNITLYQKKENFFIFNCEQKEICELARKSKAQKIPFNLRKKSVYEFFNGYQKSQIKGCWVEKEDIVLILKGEKEKIIKIKDISLLGKFNILNVMPSIIIGKLFNLPTKIIVRAIKSFRGLPHRLEFVGKFGGIKFYNDSLATVPEATIEALETLGNDVQTILLGGFDRGVSFKSLVKKIDQAKIKTIILFPESGLRIGKELLAEKKEKLPRIFLVQNMEDAVTLAFKYTPSGKICLLSPASPSFGLFKDYRERGNLFKKYIKLKDL